MLHAVLDALLPPRCPGCGREGIVLCDRCAAPLWRRVAEPPGVPIGLLAPLPEGIVQIEWCASYAGPVRAALHALKYAGERRLADPLGAALAARWRAAACGGDMLVPVPVHPTRRRERGFDQAEDLARACGRVLGLPVAYAVERRERTAAMHALGRAARQSNVHGAFAVRPGQAGIVRGRWVVVVDDITTTGATLTGCAAALEAAGAFAVSALTVARDT